MFPPDGGAKMLLKRNLKISLIVRSIDKKCCIFTGEEVHTALRWYAKSKIKKKSQLIFMEYRRNSWNLWITLQQCPEILQF